MNGGAGGIGDGHPALQDLEVRHAIAHAIDRDTLLRACRLGPERSGRSDPVTRPAVDAGTLRRPDVRLRPRTRRQMLDDAGYLDTDGDGVREMPDGSEPLEFRYVERSESDEAPADP
jgi:peptide/nickel transport system substrate-binding protein